MDRSLATLLRSLQTSHSYQDATRLLPTATGLLSRLSNPLNVTLLSSQLLSYDSLYSKPIELSRCRQIFSVFYTAALRFVEDLQNPEHERTRSALSLNEWAKAVIKGADEKSPRWRHTLLIGGVLLALYTQDHGAPSDLRTKLEAAVVMASNLALREQEVASNSQYCIAFVLNHTFPLLSDHHRKMVDYNLLLPVLIDATYFSTEGLDYGYWIGIIDADVRQTTAHKFNWSTKSPSFARVQSIRSSVLISALSPLSRLIAHSAEEVADKQLIIYTVDRIAEFARNVALSWRQNKLSEIELSEEAQFLDQETISQSFPVLLQVFRDTMFATILILRTVIGRLLCDRTLASDPNAPTIATRALTTLRDLYFISHRFGQSAMSQFIFINYTAIDILNQYPRQAENFLTLIKPAEVGRIPAHPLDRINDLFYLNTAEHFTLSLNAHANESLIFDAAAPYISTQGDRRLGEIYEAAHSTILATFAAPQNAIIVSRHVPFYVETLLSSFPQILTPRQFRLAIKTIVRLAAPPQPVAVAMPMLQAIILDLLLQRSLQASEDLLPLDQDSATEKSPPLSEKVVLVLSIIDCLSAIPIPLLEEWLPITADQFHKFKSQGQRSLCQQRFWETLSNGDMDVDRAVTCVTWWNTRGGRELVLYGDIPDDPEYMMSGALQNENKL